MTEGLRIEPQTPTRLVVSLANFEEAELILPWAAALAGSLKVPVRLLHVLDPAGPREQVDVASAVAHDHLALLVSDVRMAGVAIDTVMAIGLPREEIPRHVEEHPGSLLMMLGGGRGGIVRTVLGSTADEVIRALTTSFIVLPPRVVAPRPLTRILVATDRSELAEAILTAAKPVSQQLGVDVVTVEVIEPASRPGHEFLAVQPIIDERTMVLRGHAGPMILSAARARDAGVIVVGAHGAGGMTRLVLGSTSDWLARNADRPVLVVPEPIDAG